MSSYQDLIDADMGAPPVSTVDVDRIMVRQDHRMRYQKIGAGGALGVMVAAFAFGFTMLPRAGGPEHTTQPAAIPQPRAAATPAPSHTPTTSETADRLTAALAQLPNRLHVPKNAAFDVQNVGQLKVYVVGWRYQGVDYSISIEDDGKPDFTINGCAPKYIGVHNEDCTQDVTSAGITLKLLNPYHATKFVSLIALYNLADGTSVQVQAFSGARPVLSRSLMPLLVTTAHNPGFTLHP
jgi:hypothetical protein